MSIALLHAHVTIFTAHNENALLVSPRVLFFTGGPPDDGDDEGGDDGWEPGGEGQPSTLGMIVLLVVGAWALWEYKRPGGSLNPNTKEDKLRARREAMTRQKAGMMRGGNVPSARIKFSEK